MSLRNLQWAADAKRCDEWDRTCHVISAIGATGLSPRAIDPDKINPYKQGEQEKPLTEEQQRKLNKAALMEMRAALSARSKKKPKG